jgi:hypothetical protein
MRHVSTLAWASMPGSWTDQLLTAQGHPAFPEIGGPASEQPAKLTNIL